MTGLASRPWLIVPVCAAMHIGFAICLSMWPEAIDAAPLNIAGDIIGPKPLVLVLIGTAALSIVPMYWALNSDRIQLCLWPQQAMLFLAVGSICQAIAKSPAPAVTFVECSAVFYLAGGHLAATIRNWWIGLSGDDGHLR